MSLHDRRSITRKLPGSSYVIAALILTRSVSEGRIPRSRFLKLRFSGNPLRERGKIDLDSSLAYASGYQKPMPHAKAQHQDSRFGLVRSRQKAATLRVVMPANNASSRPCHPYRLALLLAGLLLAITGCTSRRQATFPPPRVGAIREIPRQLPDTRNVVALAAHQSDEQPPDALPAPVDFAEDGVGAAIQLTQLETLAQSMNPGLLRLGQEVAAAEARTGHIGKLPDPTLAANFFTHPIETAAGSQRSKVSVMQMVPWLSRLDAQSQQAYFEAMALQQAYEANRLKVVADVRTFWYRLYVLGKQIETSRANQQLLQTLINSANGRVLAGQGSPADVRMGALAVSQLEEKILTYRQQSASTKAELNRVVGRDTDHPVDIPNTLDVSLPNWSHGMLRQIAWEHQPEIVAAELRTQATSWGIEVARLQRRPNVSLSASWFTIDDNRPASTVVEVGRDAWSLGAQVSLPLWRQKNDAQEAEAAWKHSASHASVDETRQRYDAMLRDLWEKARTAKQTAALYQDTLKPQALETLEIDQVSYPNGTVGFDRLMQDVRSLLMVELGAHRAIGELAAVLARIQQAVGTDLVVAPVHVAPLPPPTGDAQ